MKKRKLLTPSAYMLIESRINIGVPLARVIKDLELNISRPALSKLLAIQHDCFNASYHVDDHIAMQNSLNPKWIDSSGPLVQEQPDDWKYEGFFPIGVWVHENN